MRRLNEPNSCRRFLKSNTTFKAFQTLKHQSALIVRRQVNKNVLTYFSVKVAELQFSRIFIGVQAKLLVDPRKMKL